MTRGPRFARTPPCVRELSEGESTVADGVRSQRRIRVREAARARARGGHPEAPEEKPVFEWPPKSHLPLDLSGWLRPSPRALGSGPWTAVDPVGTAGRGGGVPEASDGKLARVGPDLFWTDSTGRYRAGSAGRRLLASGRPSGQFHHTSPARLYACRGAGAWMRVEGFT